MRERGNRHQERSLDYAGKRRKLQAGSTDFFGSFQALTFCCFVLEIYIGAAANDIPAPGGSKRCQGCIPQTGTRRGDSMTKRRGKETNHSAPAAVRQWLNKATVLRPFATSICMHNDERSGSLASLCWVEMCSWNQSTILHCCEYLSQRFKFMTQFFLRFRSQEGSPQHHLTTHSNLRAFFLFQLEFRGFCPVTYVRGGRRYESLTGGSLDHVVEYDERLFSLRGEDEVVVFLREPTAYSAVPLPQKLPPPSTTMNVAALPMLGYMEQTVSAIITDGITAVGLKRPHHPFLSSKQSALLYLALYLKAHNPRWVVGSLWWHSARVKRQTAARGSERRIRNGGVVPVVPVPPPVFCTNSKSLFHFLFFCFFLRLNFCFSFPLGGATRRRLRGVLACASLKSGARSPASSGSTCQPSPTCSAQWNLMPS